MYIFFLVFPFSQINRHVAIELYCHYDTCLSVAAAWQKCDGVTLVLALCLLSTTECGYSAHCLSLKCAMFCVVSLLILWLCVPSKNSCYLQQFSGNDGNARKKKKKQFTIFLHVVCSFFLFRRHNIQIWRSPYQYRVLELNQIRSIPSYFARSGNFDFFVYRLEP